MTVIDGQLDVLDLLSELEATPTVTFTYYRTEDYRYGCPCGFCGKKAIGFHPEGYFSNGQQYGVCAICDGRKKPPRDEWRLG